MPRHLGFLIACLYIYNIYWNFFPREYLFKQGFSGTWCSWKAFLLSVIGGWLFCIWGGGSLLGFFGFESFLYIVNFLVQILSFFFSKLNYVHCGKSKSCDCVNAQNSFFLLEELCRSEIMKPNNGRAKEETCSRCNSAALKGHLFSFSWK